MKPYIEFSIYIACLAGLFSYSLTVNAENGEAYSPRQYCQQTNGVLTETGHADIYLCCYTQQAQCIVSNTRTMQSMRLDFNALWSGPHSDDVFARAGN